MFDESGEVGADEGEVVEVLSGVGALVEAVVEVDDAVGAGGADDGCGQCGAEHSHTGHLRVAGVEYVADFWQEDVALIVHGLFDDAAASEHFQRDGVSSSTEAAVAGEGPVGGFA